MNFAVLERRCKPRVIVLLQDVLYFIVDNLPSDALFIEYLVSLYETPRDAFDEPSKPSAIEDICVDTVVVQLSSRPVRYV